MIINTFNQNIKPTVMEIALIEVFCSYYVNKMKGCSSNVLHSRALLQKSATGCLVHHYSYPSAQFVENNTLDQIDGNYALENLYGQLDGKLYFGSN